MIPVCKIPGWGKWPSGDTSNVDIEEDNSDIDSDEEFLAFSDAYIYGKFFTGT